VKGIHEMTKHTKTPWHLGGQDSLEIRAAHPNGGDWANLLATVHAATARLADIRVSGGGGTAWLAESQANAAMIVRAVNAHEALVEALERIVNAHAAMVDDFEEQVVEIAKAALRAAKGEA